MGGALEAVTARVGKGRKGSSCASLASIPKDAHPDSL